MITSFGDYTLNKHDDYYSIVKKNYYDEIEMIPNSIGGIPVLDIENESYSGNSEIVEVIIDEGILRIGDDAFYSCDGLISIKLPSTLMQIGAGAFYETALTSIDIPSKVEIIPEFCFSNCHDLLVVNIEDGLKCCLSKSFRNCESLRTIRFPKTMKFLDMDAFEGCDNLNTITIPKACKIINADNNILLSQKIVRQ